MVLPLLPGSGGGGGETIGDTSVGSLVTDQGGVGGSGPPIVYRPGQGQNATTITAGADQTPIEELLRYGSPLHQEVLARLNSRRELSSRHIGKRYERWDEVDEHCRMYIDLSRRAKRGDGSTDPTKAEMPFERAIVVPMSMAVLTVRLTQLMQIFGSREPMIQLEGRGPEDVKAAKLMEALLGYDMQQMSAFTTLYALCQDAEKYGMGVIHDCWEVEQGWQMKSPTVQPQMKAMLEYMGLGGLLRPRQVWGVTREFNRWECVDPFHFWPDPRAPVSQVQQGEFIGHRIYRGMMHFKERNTANGGVYFNTEHLPKASGKGQTRTGRNRFDMGDFQLREAPEGDDRGFYGLDIMQVKLIPKDWKLGPGERPEIWRFGWVDETCIVRAHPDGYAHGQFSYSVGESVPDEHASNNPGTLENLEGIQRTINWLVNSHIANVRKHLNNAVLYGPSLIEEADLLEPGPASHIRLSALGEKLMQERGMSLQAMMMQIPWADVTKGHLQTTNALFDMAQRLAATSDPQMSQTTDDERTLGEVQQVIAGSSARLAMTAKMLDAQALTPLAYRSISNRQQFTELDQFVRIAGDMAREMGGVDRLLIKPSDIGGSFDYVPHSGTVPPDPARFAQVWVKMLEGAAKIPQLSQPGPDGKVLDVREIFNEAARAMGVKNIQSFYVSVMPDPRVAALLAAGNLAPAGAAENGRVPGAGVQTPMVQGADLQ